MTVSFHKYGDFFPGTGDIKDRGYGTGRMIGPFYSIEAYLLLCLEFLGRVADL